MQISIVRRFEFAAAHQLKGLRELHKCSRLHGHNYEVFVEVRLAPLGQLVNGMVLDAEVLDATIGAAVKGLDHRFLNDTLDQPTAEEIAKHLFTLARLELDDTRVQVWSVSVSENGRLTARVGLG